MHAYMLFFFTLFVSTSLFLHLLQSTPPPPPHTLISQHLNPLFSLSYSLYDLHVTPPSHVSLTLRNWVIDHRHRMLAQFWPLTSETHRQDLFSVNFHWFKATTHHIAFKKNAYTNSRKGNDCLKCLKSSFWCIRCFKFAAFVPFF